MRKQIKRGLAGIALTLACFFTVPAFAANYSGNCVDVLNPANFDGNGNVDITDSSCSLPNFSATGYININVSGTVSTGDLSTTYGQIIITSSGGAVTTGTITPGWYATITADGTITPGVINAGGGEVNLTSTNGAVTAEDITGYYHVYITAKNDVTVGEVHSVFNEVHIKSNTGNVETEDPINGYFEVKIEAPDGKITIDSAESTYYDVQVKAGKEIITGDLTSGQYGNLVVTTPDGNITTEKLESGYHAKIKADNGAIDLDIIRVNKSDGNGNLYIVGSENVKTKDITATGTSSYGSVEIRANTEGGSSLFTIGGTSNSNGVNGTIDTTNDTGGGTTDDFIRGGVYITNGTTSGGGISVTNMSDIAVNASAARSGIIILDAKDGTLTLPAGTMQSNGATGQGAGSVNLLADEIHFADDTDYFGKPRFDRLRNSSRSCYCGQYH